MRKRRGVDKSKGAGRTGLKTTGGWNKGQRYGYIVSAEEIAEEEKRTLRPYPRGCVCGTCHVCKRRVYRRVWKRKQLMVEDPNLDAKMDAQAAEWLKNLEKGK